MKFYNFKKTKLAIGILICINQGIIAQLNIPFSAVGFGDFVQNKNVANSSMGGISVADYSYYYTNTQNPASYGMAQNTPFRRVILDIGLHAQQQELISKNAITTNTNTIINYANLSLPIYKNLGLVIGYQPLHNTNYELNKKVKNNLLDTGGISIESKGEGSLYQIFIGIGHQFKHLAYGINIGYLAGKKSEEYNNVPLTNYTVQKIGTLNTNYYSGAMLQYGIIYEAMLQKATANQSELAFQIGINGNIPTTLKQSYNTLQRTIVKLSDGSTTNLDTIANTYINIASTYPTILNGGFIIKRYDSWKIGIDVEYQQWASTNFIAQANQLLNQTTFRIGYEVIPNAKSSNYFAQIPYRFGFHTGNYYAKNSGEIIYPFGISAGIGFFIKKYSYSLQSTVINVGVEYLRRGFQTNVFYENFYSFKVGFSLSDVWFRKQKFY